MSGHQTFKKVTFWWPDRATKISRWWCDENNILQSRILPPIISDRKNKHPTFILASYGAEYYPPFISDRKSKHPTFILASYRAEYYRHSFPTVNANTPDIYFSVIPSWILPPFFPTVKAKHPNHSFPTVKAHTQHLFQRHTEPNITVIHFRP